MSNRRGGPGGRKGKNSKNKQGKGGPSSASSASSSLVQQFPPDECHNLILPCCQMLEDACRDLWTIDGGLSSAKQPAHQTQRPASLLGQMLRNHLLEKRRREVAAEAEASNSIGGGAAAAAGVGGGGGSPAKKKKNTKKKKKKKGNKASDAASTTSASATATGTDNPPKAVPETDETDSTAAISSTVSQDSQSVSTSVSKEEARTSSSSTGAISASTTSANNTTSASTHSSSASTCTTANNSSHTINNNNNSSSDSHLPPSALTTPVDAFLDRLISQQPPHLQHSQGPLADEDDNNNSNNSSNTTSNTNNPTSTSSSSSTPRNLESFLKYLNEKCRSSDSSSSCLCITHQELESACQAIKCSVCRPEMQKVLQQHTRQPVFLAGIHFGENTTSYRPHNGLAIPIHNPQKNTTELPAPSVDFDYVALEEGVSNHGGPWNRPLGMPSLRGIPYFHPQITPPPSTTEAEGMYNSNHDSNNLQQRQQQQPNNSKGASSNNYNKGEQQWAPAKDRQQQQQHGPLQLEWRFVSSSATLDQQTPTAAATTAPAAKSSSNNNVQDDDGKRDSENANATNSMIITIQDVEHIVKNVMLPLSISADDLMGADTAFTGKEMDDLHRTILELESGFCDDIKRVKEELVKYKNLLDTNAEEEISGENINVKVAPVYEELETGLEQLFYEVVMDLVWDGLFWLGRDGDNVVRTTESWRDAVCYLTDDVVARAMHSLLSIVEEFENELAELADNTTGRIPAMFVSQEHRMMYSKMLDKKIKVIHALIENIAAVSNTMELAWPAIANGSRRSNTGVGHVKPFHERGLAVSFRRKWFAQQEFFRAVAARQSRTESAKKGSPNTKAKKDALERHKASPGVPPDSKAWENRVIQKLDTSGDDLLRSLIDLSKTVRIESIPERKEEQMTRHAKSMGLLERIGGEVFAQFADTDDAKNHPISFALQDEKLKNECRTLSTQIKQQHTQQMLSKSEEQPSIAEQRLNAAKMTIASIKLLRMLRNCVTASYESKTPEPVMPLQVVSWINNMPSAHYGHPLPLPTIDMRNCSYETLLDAWLVRDKNQQDGQCIGGTALPRFTSILLALLYAKLSEQCSQWHAELAEQELLKNMMSESEAGFQAGSQNGDPTMGSKKDGVAGRNGLAANQQSQGKSKKKKKKGNVKAAAVAQPSDESALGSENSEAAARAQPNHVHQISTSEDEATTNTMNGHQQPKGAVAKAEETKGGEQTKGNAVNENRVVAASGTRHSDKPAETEMRREEEAEISTVEVDKHLGVRDYTGVFQSAESFLVGRLTALFKEAAQGKGSVLIV